MIETTRIVFRRLFFSREGMQEDYNPRNLIRYSLLLRGEPLIRQVPIWARLTLASIYNREEQSTCSHVQVPNYANSNYFSVASLCRLNLQ